MRRVMRPWEVVATLITSGQIVLFDIDGNRTVSLRKRAGIVCPRTNREITLANVRDIEIEHWPTPHEHGGDVSPDNAVVSLSEGHKQQTKREAKSRSKERRLKVARRVKADVEQRVSKGKWRLKKKIGTGEVVRVRVR